METAVDRFGRIVIPKPLRDHLGLEPGDRLRIEQVPGGIRLEPLNHDSPVLLKERVLVYDGLVEENVELALEAHRRRQIRKGLSHLKKS